MQDRDAGALDPATLKVVTKRAPTAAELADLAFAWRVCKHVKSNAIVYARDGAAVGVGAGQMSRVDRRMIAARKAEDAARAAGLPASRTQGLGRRLRRLLPLRRRARRSDRGGRDRRHPARRLDARRRGDRRRRRGRESRWCSPGCGISGTEGKRPGATTLRPTGARDRRSADDRRLEAGLGDDRDPSGLARSRRRHFSPRPPVFNRLGDILSSSRRRAGARGAELADRCGVADWTTARQLT